MTKRRELKGAKQIADYLNISVRLLWYQHKVKPFPFRRLRKRGAIRIYVSDLERYKRNRLSVGGVVFIDPGKE